MQGNAADAQGFLIRLLQIGFAAGSLVALGILLLQVEQQDGLHCAVGTRTVQLRILDVTMCSFRTARRVCQQLLLTPHQLRVVAAAVRWQGQIAGCFFATMCLHVLLLHAAAIHYLCCLA